LPDLGGLSSACHRACQVVTERDSPSLFAHPADFVLPKEAGPTDDR
jgi:hypothetical protein